MIRIWGSAGRYIQGPGVLGTVKKYADIHGSRALYLTDSFMYPTVEPIVSAGYDGGEGFTMAVFDGQISRRNIDAFLRDAAGGRVDTVVGIGGGKVIDVAKVVAMTMGSALIICPTTAATDAPTSAMSILYSDSGEMNEILIHRRNPDLVLADTRLILSAPPRFLISGLGDALSTCYEGLSNDKTGHANYVWCDREEGLPTVAGRAIARACLETLYEKGEAAVVAARAGTISPQFEDVVEANILLSGIGFENVGCSIAHAIGNAFTAIPEGEKKMHGERVGFGTLCLLVGENYPRAELDRAFSFCIRTGVPACLADLGIPDDPEKLALTARASLTAESWAATPFQATEESVAALIRATSAMGEAYKKALAGTPMG